MDKNLLRDKEWLESVHKLYSASKIATLLNVSNPTVRYWLKKHDIQPHSVSEGMLTDSAGLSLRAKKYWTDDNKSKHSTLLIKVQSTRKAALSASAKKNWQLNRAALLEASRKLHADPDYLKKVSDTTKSSWTETRRLKQSKISKALWNDPDYVAKRAAALATITSTSEFRAKVSKNSKKLWRKKSHRSKMAKVMSAVFPTSILEVVAQSLLESLGIIAKPISLGPWTYDLFFEFGCRKILLECQGSYWHSLPNKILRDKQKKTYTERHLPEYELHYLYEHEFYGIKAIYFKLLRILNLPLNIAEFTFKDLTLQTVKQAEANQFFNQFHYLSSGRAGLNIAASINKQPTAVLSYTGITRKQTADRLKLKTSQILELSRFCIHPNYHRKNFGSWLLSKSLQFVPKEISMLVAFSDLGMGHTGTIYKAAGWIYDGKTKPSYWYIDEIGNRYHKKTVWDQAKRLRLQETDYARKYGLIRCNGFEVLRFIKPHGHAKR